MSGVHRDRQTDRQTERRRKVEREEGSWTSQTNRLTVSDQQTGRQAVRDRQAGRKRQASKLRQTGRNRQTDSALTDKQTVH